MRYLSITALAAFALLAAPVSRAQMRSLLPAPDLGGWHVDVPDADTINGLRAPFVMRDGILRIAGEPRGHLITDATHANYVLVVEYRFPGTPGNAGVLVHASTPRALYSMFPKSMEVQMESGNAGDFWCIMEDITVPDMERRRGPRAAWGITEGKGRRIRRLGKQVELPPGEWNRMVISVLGRSITVEVNGRIVNRGTNATADRGQIAIQSEGATVEIRTLDLTPLASRGYESRPSGRMLLRPDERENLAQRGVRRGRVSSGLPVAAR